MLPDDTNRSLAFSDVCAAHDGYEVVDPKIEILDYMSARFTAVFNGPADSKVIGRSWISDADGTMVDGQTGEIPTGTRAALVLTIPKSKVQHGDIIACMRVEWPLYQTKHVIKWTLLRGEIVHPPMRRSEARQDRQRVQNRSPRSLADEKNQPHERTLEMIKSIMCCCRRPEMTREEFQDYWLNKHAPFFMKHAATMRAKKYVQSHTVESPLNEGLRESRGMLPEFDGVAEVWFESEQDLIEAMSSPEGQTLSAALLEDEGTFIDHAKSAAFIVQEREL